MPRKVSRSDLYFLETETTKHCSRCLKLLSIDSFYLATREGRKGRQGWCKSCIREAKRIEYQQRTPEEHAVVTFDRRRRMLYQNYGLDIDDYNVIVEQQDGRCEICDQPETKRGKRSGRLNPLSVDHDHRTGLVRGILCHRCNMVLGSCDDDIFLLEKLIAYLKKHQTLEVGD